MYPSLPYLCGVAAAVYVAICLVCAAVRWFHMCPPYNRNPRYYYPGRPYVTAAGFGSRPSYYAVKAKLGTSE